MSLNISISLGTVAFSFLALLVWSHLGPYAGVLFTGAAFLAGCMFTLTVIDEGKTK